MKRAAGHLTLSGLLNALDGGGGGEGGAHDDELR